MPAEKQNFLILGLGVSGLAAAELARAQGGRVTVLDGCQTASLADRARRLENQGVEVHLGWQQESYNGPVDLAIISPGIGGETALGKLAAGLACPVISELEYGFQHCLCPILGITGTNGKTTTVELLVHCLTHAGQRVVAAGNIGTPLCEVAGESANLDCIVTEISSFQLEKLDRFQPTASALLNLTPDHLNRYASYEEYIGTKARLLTRAGSASRNVLREDLLDCAVVQQALPDDLSPITFSSKDSRSATFFVDSGGILCERTPSGITPLLSRDRLQLQGAHNMENALAAVALCAYVGVSSHEAAAALPSFCPSAHRLEAVGQYGGLSFVNDSKATNPDSLIRALEASGSDNDKKIVLIAGGLNKGLDFCAVAPLLRECVRKVVLIGACRDQLAQQWKATADCEICSSLAQAVDRAIESASPGDTVLLSPGCASQDMFSNYAERGRQFCELIKRRFKG
jgi:UDP-N-acetylmuramoylalanine--D-glutamate ligase